MFGSEILEVSVGVVMMFLATSLASSAVNEFIESFLKYRARDLENGIRELLSDPAAQGLARQFYSHALISGLYPGNYNPASATNLPSYIPARTFAITLMDLLQPATSNVASGASATIPTSKAGTASLLPANLNRNPIQEFRQTIGGLPESPVKAAMLPLVDAAGDDPVGARQNIEDWYNAAMDRVSGRYKRRTQFILVGIGFVLSSAVNADTLGFARYLSTSKAARELVVSRATTITSGSSPGAGTSATPPDLTSALGWLNSAGGLPIGWHLPPSPDQSRADQNILAVYRIDPQRIPQTFPEGASKVLGLVITAVSVSLGAPFWFDILNKVMVVRSTIKPAEKSHVEPDKD